MKLSVFTVYDSKAEAYITPFFFPEKAMAIRVFQDCVDDQNHQFGKHPEDYTLYYLGIFDSLHAEFLEGTKQSLITGLEAKRQFEIDETILDDPDVKEKLENLQMIKPQAS